MILNGADTVLLMHTPPSYRRITEGDAAMVAAFAEKIATLKLRIFVATADTALGDKLQKQIPGLNVLASAGEMTAVRGLFKDKAVSHIAVVNGIYPLLDLALTQKIFGIHEEYRADISYGENLPPGIAPYFVSRDLLESIEILIQGGQETAAAETRDDELDAVGIRAFVEKNINHFHAEVHYEEPDLRLMRLDFSLSNRRSAAKAAAFYPKVKNKNEPYAELQALIDDDPALLVTFPSYIELEFCSTATHKSFFSPLAYIEQAEHRLSREHFNRVKAYIAAGLGDTSVCASGLGEPLEHPDAAVYLTELLDDPNIRYVFVETDGTGLQKLLPLATHTGAGKLRVIVLLNSLQKYTEYAGAPAAKLADVKAGMRALTQALTQAGKNAQEIVYLQALKVEENETEVDNLYALAEELGASFLFQKYNRYAGLMPERRVSDMTPLERYACWHLRRDLFIRANGDVAFCKQTVDQSKNSARGNLSGDKLADIWNTQRADFVANYRAQYPSHLPCANCDEYFTFNF